MTDASLALDLTALHAESRRRLARQWAVGLGVAAVVVAALVYGDALTPGRYVGAVPTIWQLFKEAMPPDFSRWHQWGKPLAETLSMSVAGTVIAVGAALPLAALAARNVVPSPLAGGATRMVLNLLRSIPGLIWGVIFVAAVGFGPLPGILALAAHSTGMLGKLFAEALEHVDPAPGDALRSHGVSSLGVLRFSVLPQVMPRLVDVTLYRFEHNLRAATTLGVVGAGGLGLEIVTAFHLFEYREASALILVLLGLVAAINMAGGRLRAWLISLGG